MKEKCVSFKNVCKKYRIYNEKNRTLKEYFTRMKKTKDNDNIVLDNVSFDIFEGESVGIIGNNGVGKSTILKLISKIIYEDSGEIKVNGKVASLLELGAGFDEDFTGRQNIYFNASILGMSKKEVDEIVEDVIEFSGISEFIDSPVRTYSSGMYMRLAFSVAINVKADILIIDEVLAVGDQEFQHKCLNKVLELNKQGVTIIFVSHDVEIVKKICNRCIWLENGKIKEDGLANEVVDDYMKSEGF